MKKLAVISAAILTLAISTEISAQDNTAYAHSVTITIPEVALLDLEGAASVTLAPTPPSEAGNAFDFSSATDNSTWVNYSSVVATGKSRGIKAHISSGTVPSGLLLKVAVGAAAGAGKGNLGEAGAQVTLNASPQDVVSGIGSCYTGDGANNGHNLAYSLVLSSDDNYGQLVEGTASVSVTYTITEDN